MFRLFVIAAPLLLTVGATMAAFKLPLKGAAEERLRTLMRGAIAVGLIFSGLALWQQIAIADQNARDRDIAAERAATDAADKVSQGLKQDYEQKIRALNAQIGGLRAQLGNSGGASLAGPSGDNPANQTKPGKLYWEQEDSGAFDSIVIRFKTSEAVNIPAFVAICDGPCRATRAQAGAGSEGTELTGIGSKNVAGYIFKKPRPMPAGSDGYIILQTAGKGTTVTDFRILRETEIPEGLK